MSLPADVEQLLAELDANSEDAEKLLSGLTAERGEWRLAPGTWSVAECLDHLAVANRVYLAALREGAKRARSKGQMRRGPARPGLIGRWFIRSLEPPVNIKTPAPSKIRPRPSPPLGASAEAFRASQHEVTAFTRESAGLDLAGAMFHNPLARGVKFSLATGLNVIAAHERRHLWQAWNVRRAAEAVS